MREPRAALDRFCLALLLAPGRALRGLGRGLYRRRRGLLYLLIGLVAAHLAATIVTGRMLDNELARLRTEGVLLPVDKLVPHVPAGEVNAADLYQKAFDTRRVSTEDEERLRQADFTPQRVASMRPVLAANTESLMWLRRAARTRHCAFPVPWDLPEFSITAEFPHRQELRAAALLLRADAVLAASEGRVDAALADSSDVVRMAEHLKMEPTYVSQLIAYALQANVAGSLQHSLSMGAPSPQVARGLVTQLAAADNVGPMARAMRGEVTIKQVPDIEDALREGGRYLPGVWQQGHPDAEGVRRARFFRLYISLGRPVFNLDARGLLRRSAHDLSLVSRHWPDLPAGDRARYLQDPGAPPAGALGLTAMLSVSYPSLVWYRDRATANLGGAQIALALCLHKAEHGAYPASLAVLEGEGYKLPRDPFTGKPYQYRREGAGFVVYSLGPDMKDDGGVPQPTYEERQKLTEKQQAWLGEHYDVSFRVTR